MWRGFRTDFWRFLKARDSANAAIPAVMVVHPIDAVPGVFNPGVFNPGVFISGKTNLPAGKTAELEQIMMGIGN